MTTLKLTILNFLLLIDSIEKFSESEVLYNLTIHLFHLINYVNKKANWVA
jgi:hypothetical protein